MTKKFLLDTNVCIFLLQGKHNVAKHLFQAGRKNCYVSEMTIAELLFGYANEKDPRNEFDANNILELFQMVRIYDSLSTYAETKAYLKHKGKLIEEFDMLIGATAVHNNLVMVTENIDHFSRIPNIQIENWIERPQSH